MHFYLIEETKKKRERNKRLKALEVFKKLKFEIDRLESKTTVHRNDDMDKTRIGKSDVIQGMCYLFLT